MDYNEACRQATTDQGLDPICDVLRAAGIPFSVDQTGGFTMCINVPIVEGGAHYLYVTAGEFTIGDQPDTAYVGEYWDCPTLYGADDWHSEGWSEYHPHEPCVFPLADLPQVIRDIARNPHDCPDHAGLVSA